MLYHGAEGGKFVDNIKEEQHQKREVQLNAQIKRMDSRKRRRVAKLAVAAEHEKREARVQEAKRREIEAKEGAQEQGPPKRLKLDESIVSVMKAVPTSTTSITVEH